MIAAAAFTAVAAFLVVPPRPRVRVLSGVGHRSLSLAPAPAAATAAALVTALYVGWPLGLVLAVPVWLGTHRVVSRIEPAAARRHRQAVERQLPGVLDLVCAALLAGRPPSAAFAIAADAAPDPAASEARRIGDLLAVSLDTQAIWAGVVSESPLAPVARALRRAATSGVPAAEVLAHVADEMRRERLGRLRSRGRSVAVATAAPLGLCFLPAFFLVAIVPTFIGVAGFLRG